MPDTGNPDGSQNTNTQDTPNTNGVADQSTAQGVNQAISKGDWRVRLSLAPDSNYLYNDPGDNPLLWPLAMTDGVIFPYTPTISVAYNAAYDTTAPVHSNYNIYSYTKSSVDNISITCDFTAQDTTEANYLLAVIHFFKSLTKMFYGQEQNPKAGTPPPMVFLYGLGQFQFSGQPLVVNNFTYTLPNNVDYIRATGITTGPSGATVDALAPTPDAPKQKWLDKVAQNTGKAIGSALSTAGQRLAQGAIASLGGTASALFGNLMPGGKPGSATVDTQLQYLGGMAPGAGGTNATYVPSQIQLTINCYAVVSRYKQRKFNYAGYANGSLIKGGYW